MITIECIMVVPNDVIAQAPHSSASDMVSAQTVEVEFTINGDQ